MNGFETIDDFANYLGSFRLRFGTEDQLQCDINQALTDAGVDFVREHRLDQVSRIDFYVPAIQLGIECKTDGGFSAVYQQLLRYADHASIAGLILVSRRRAHVSALTELRAKPYRFLWIGGGSL